MKLRSKKRQQGRAAWSGSGRRWLAGALVGLGAMQFAVPARAADYTWNLDAAGTWDLVTSNWLLSGLPSAWSNGANVAVFGSKITANRAIAVAAGGVTAGSLSFTNTGTFAYTVGTALNTVTLNNGASDATILVGRGFRGTATYSGTGGNTVTGSALVFANNLAITNDGAFGTTALTIAGTVDRTVAGGSISFAGQGNTVISGAIGATVTGGVTKSGSGTALLTGTNLYTGTNAVSGGVLGITSTDAGLGAAANGVTIGAGGTFRFANTVTSARAFTINGTAGSPSGIDLQSGAAVTLTGTGAGAGLVGSGTALLSLTGGTTSGTLSVEGAQTGFTGSLIVGAPGMQLVGSVVAQRIFNSTSSTTLRLQNAGTLPNATAITVSNGALLTIVQPAVAVTGRLGTAPITLNSGRFTYTSSANGGAAITETMGALTLLGTPFISGSGAAGSTGGTSVTFGSLSRTDNAALWLRGPATGTGAIGGTPGTGPVNYKVAVAPTLIGAGGAGTPSVGIVPWAASTSTTTGTDPTSLITYDANGFRPLTAAEASIVTNFATLTAAAGNNVNIQGAVVMAGNVTINSLFNSTGTPAFTGSGILTVTSGAFSVFNATTVNGPTLNFGSNTGYFLLGFPVAIQGTSFITGSNGLSVNAASNSTNYRLTYTNTVANTFTGGTSINGTAQVAFTADNQLGATGAGNDIRLGGGQLLFIPASAATVALDASRNIAVNAANGTVGTSFAGATLQIPGTISGAGQMQFGGGASVSATGVVQLTGGANTYSGGTVVGTGTLGINSPSQLGTGSLFLNGGTLRADAALAFAASPIVVASSTLNTNGFNVGFNGGLSGSGGTLGTSALTNTLTKTGLGTLTVGADSSFAGVFALSAGGLTLSGNGAFPDLTSLTVAGATALLDNTATNVVNRLGDATAVTLSGTGTLRLTGNGAAGGVEQLGTVTATGSGNVVQMDASGGQITSFLFNNLVATGSMLVRGTNLGLAGTSGRLFLNNFNGAAVTNGQFLTNVTAEDLSNLGVIESAVYDTTFGVRIALASDFFSGTAIQNAAPTSLATTANFRVNPAVANPVPVVDAANTVASLRFAPSGVVNYAGGVASALTVTSGGILTEAGAASSVTNSGAGVLSLTAGSAALAFTTNGDLTVAAALGGTGGVSKSGAGVLTLNGAYGTTGALTVNAGTLNLNAALTTALAVTQNGGTTNINVAPTAAIPVTVSAGSFNLNATPTVGIPVTISAGSFSLGAGVAPTFTSLTGTGGTLAFGANTPIFTGTASSHTGTITGTGGFTYNPTAIAAITLGGNNAGLSGNVVGNASARYLITNPNALGTGTLNLSAQAASSSFSLPTLGYNFGIGVTGTVPTNIVLPSAAIDAFFIQSNSTFAGQGMRLTGLISGGSATTNFVFDETGSSNANVVILDNPGNTFTATLRPDFGGFAFTSDGALGNASNPINLNSTSTSVGAMRFDANNVTVGSGHTVTVSTAAAINTNGNNGTIAGVVAGTAALSKMGAGTLTLSNVANTHTGTLTVNAGTLLVNGTTTAGSAVTVNTGATLGGSGTVGGSVTVASGGTLAPGNSPGILSTGNVSLASGSTFLVDLAGNAAGTGYDQLNVTGTVGLGSASLLINAGFAPNISDLFFLVANDGADAITGTFNGLSEGGVVSFLFSGTTYGGNITYVGNSATNALTGGNDVALYGFVAIPEPGTLALLALGILPGTALLRRRKRG